MDMLGEERQMSIILSLHSVRNDKTSGKLDVEYLQMA